MKASTTQSREVDHSAWLIPVLKAVMGAERGSD
jgi:hypothetical protein